MNLPRVSNWILCAVVACLARLPVFANQSVSLAWDPSPDPTAVGYKLYYGGASGNYTNFVSAGNATNATVSGLSEGVTYYFAATSVSASGAESGFSNEASEVIPTTNTNAPAAPVSQSPTLNAINDISLAEGTASQTLTLTGISTNSPGRGQLLKITVSSSDPRLIPTPQIRYTNGYTTALMTLKPVANVLGTATITVTVANGAASTNAVRRSFKVTLLPIMPPALHPIANVTVPENAGLQTVTLTGITSGWPGSQSLKVSAASSNLRLVPAPTIQYTSPSNTAVLTFRPMPNATGIATLTVTVTDTPNLQNRQNPQNTQKPKNTAIIHFTVTVTPSISSATVPANTRPVLTMDAAIRGKVSFQVNGSGSGKCVIQATSDFIHWDSVLTNVAPFTFQDSAAKTFSQRFYRVLYLP